MTTSIWDYNATPTSNTGSPPAGFGTGQNPSQVRVVVQDLMGEITEAVHSTTATGTADALVVTLTNVPAALTDGMEILVRAAAANATATPTLNLNSLGAKTIVKFGGQALVAGDIPGNLAQCTLRYDLPNTRWELLNPANGNAGNTWVAAGGTADAITATYAPAVQALYDGLVLSFRAASANATAAPTFSPNGLTAHTITKLGGSSLAVGDIAGNLTECIVRYNLANTRWELLNPRWTSGTVIQVVNTETGAVATGTTVTQGGDIVPANTDGDQYMSVAVTPKSASSTLLIDIDITLSTSSGATATMQAALFRDSGTCLASAILTTAAAPSSPVPIHFRHAMASPGIVSTTFKVRAGCTAAGTTTMNGAAGARKAGGTLCSNITVIEIAP